ncbi:uncharacterized protein LOC144062608 isoform X2 [Vanacampus margaritifer]
MSAGNTSKKRRKQRKDFKTKQESKTISISQANQSQLLQIRMKPNEREETLLAIKENIEMESIFPEESCELLSTQELEEEDCFYRNLEHPLVCVCDEEATLEVQAQQFRLQKANAKPNTVTPASENKNGERQPRPPVFMEDIEIEMETFHKASRMKWKRVPQQLTRLVVKDVLCLPRGRYGEEIPGNTAPQGTEQEALSALGLTARITIDRQWSAKQMESRLVALFQGRVAKRAGQRFSFTYLQCIQRVLFVPVAPAEGWAGAQILRISGPGALYILTHHDHLQVSSQTVVDDRRELCLEEIEESCQNGDNLQDRWNQPQIYETIENNASSAPGCTDVTYGTEMSHR